MAMVLDFLRRKTTHADAEARAPRQPPNPPPQPMSPVNPRVTNDDGVSDLLVDLTPARRQGSQINLNKFFASAPHGLAAVLKQPSRQDLVVSKSSGSITLQASFSPQQQQQLLQQQLQNPDVPLARPMRERRKSMTVTEMVQSMQNIDVSQAALIMMPTRLRQELVQGPAAGGAGPGSGCSQLPQLLRSSPTALGPLSPDASVGGGSMGGGGGGGRLERKPSIIREAVKQQQQQPRPPAQPEAHLRNHAANIGGELHQASLAQLASALAGQGPEPPAGASTRAPWERRALQQPGNVLGPGSNGGSRITMGVSAPAPMAAQGPMAAGPGPPPVAQGSQRRSDPGEHFRNRTVPAVPMEAVMNNVRGYYRGGSGGPSSDEGPASGGGGAAGAAAIGANGYMLNTQLLSPQLLSPAGARSNNNKDLRRGVMSNRGGEQAAEEEAAGFGCREDVKLPSIGGPGGGMWRANGDAKDTAGGGGGGVKSSLTAADVAAITEALSSYQTEAARLRAVGLRKVDTRVKIDLEDDVAAGDGGMQDNGTASKVLPPPLRSRVGGKSRSHRPQPPPTAAPLGRSTRAPESHRAGAGAGAGAGGAGYDSVSRSKTLLMDVEAEMNEEAAPVRRKSLLVSRAMMADLMSEPKRR